MIDLQPRSRLSSEARGLRTRRLPLRVAEYESVGVSWLPVSSRTRAQCPLRTLDSHQTGDEKDGMLRGGDRMRRA